jgi:hypothetical protein
MLVTMVSSLHEIYNSTYDSLADRILFPFLFLLSIALIAELSASLLDSILASSSSEIHDSHFEVQRQSALNVLMLFEFMSVSTLVQSSPTCGI